MNGIWCVVTALGVALSPLQGQPQDLDLLFWDGPLGAQVVDSVATFTLFAPRATGVHVHLYDEPFGDPIVSVPMEPAAQGCWTAAVRVPRDARYYAYTVAGPSGPHELFRPDIPIADPYSKAVVTQNHYTHQARTLLFPPLEFDWGNDTWVGHAPEDLIIYEAHVRDLTAHESSGVPVDLRGTYLGAAWSGATGGLSHILSLGVNAVELLPVHEFGNLEVPYQDPSAPVWNTWNPYARNHWGYMTSYFFAPEAYYATGQSLEPGGVCGADGRQVVELKELVKTLHRHGIAVILDVVYNHVSQYDYNPFKLIDSWYYFRREEDGSFSSRSGCGNDFKTERPMARRLIVDSVLYWMREYHIDGFRFDLATMIDDTTLEEISRQARALNPKVILIAEPWGGGEYDLAKFSRLGWMAWNDRIRNGIKGRNPSAELGFIFGTFLPGEGPEVVVNHLMGSVVTGGGPFLWPWHSVNYLESHDDHTLADFIALGLGKAREDRPVGDLAAYKRLTRQELALHRLAATSLLASQGAVMLSAGQEFARRKVIAPTDAPDQHVGYIDHNSYAKDNATNWLDYRDAQTNATLVDHYRRLIGLRKRYKGLRAAPPALVHRWETGDSLCIGLFVDASQLGDPGDLLVLLNAARHPCQVVLPSGSWGDLVWGEKIWDGPRGWRRGQVQIPKTCGVVLVRRGR